MQSCAQRRAGRLCVCACGVDCRKADRHGGAAGKVRLKIECRPPSTPTHTTHTYTHAHANQRPAPLSLVEFSQQRCTSSALDKGPSSNQSESLSRAQVALSLFPSPSPSRSLHHSCTHTHTHTHIHTAGTVCSCLTHGSKVYIKGHVMRGRGEAVLASGC